MPPSELLIHISNDCSSQELSFAWSPVGPDSPAIHYNILASNCGSCPTTTKHTNVTCTDVATNSSILCSFAIQTVVCGNITGNISDPVRVNTSFQCPMEKRNTVYIASIGSLAGTLIISYAIFEIVIVVILKCKAKIKAMLDVQPTNKTGRNIQNMESMYEDVTRPLPSVSAINTLDNIAYGHTKN